MTILSFFSGAGIIDYAQIASLVIAAAGLYWFVFY
jgi:hypothetical protein